MKSISVDSASPAVKKFIRSLPLDASGVEVTIGGDVICKIIPPGQLTEDQKAIKLAELRDLLNKARARSKRFPASVIESRIRAATKAVRERR